MAFLRHTVAQLVDPQRQDPSLFQFTIEFAELLCELLALLGDISALGGRILGRRRAKLLQALLRLAGARLEFVDLGPQCVRRRVERFSKSCQCLSGDLVATDRGFDLVQRRFDRVERGWLRGLGPRARIDGSAQNEKRAHYGPKNELPANRRPIADRHECVSSRRGCGRCAAAVFALAPRAARPQTSGGVRAALVSSKPPSQNPSRAEKPGP